MRDWHQFPREFGPNRRVIAPFVGLYPTRWKIEAGFSLVRGGARLPDQRFEYHGKPNYTVGRYLRYIMRMSRVGRIRAWEYDRAGLIAYADSRPALEHLPVQDWTQGYRFYYPQGYSSAHMITVWQNQMHRIPVVIKGKTYIVYAYSTVLDPSEWSTHKTWLENEALQLGSR
jgi:hypothetical protein